MDKALKDMEKILIEQKDNLVKEEEIKEDDDRNFYK